MDIHAPSRKILTKAAEIALWIFLCWSALQHWPTAIPVRDIAGGVDFVIQMPLRDKKRLDFFFREVCFLNGWAYTLLGSKPMSIDQYTKPWAAFRDMVTHPELTDLLLDCFWPPNIRKIRHFFEPRELKMQLGWETLKKYSCYFSHSQFALREGYSSEHEIVGFQLIDTQKLVAIVSLYRDDFQTLLKEQSIAPEDLLDAEKRDVFLAQVQHDGLLGTLLGFGRNNAWLFYNCRGISPEIRSMASPWHQEDLLNLEQLNQRAASGEPWQLSDLFYPRFACNPASEETKQLQGLYRQEREKIVAYFEGKDLVEAVLALFNQPTFRLTTATSPKTPAKYRQAGVDRHPVICLF